MNLRELVHAYFNDPGPITEAALREEMYGAPDAPAPQPAVERKKSAFAELSRAEMEDGIYDSIPSPLPPEPAMEITDPSQIPMEFWSYNPLLNGHSELLVPDLARIEARLREVCRECEGKRKQTICSDCGELAGEQHKPHCHRQGMVTLASDYNNPRSEIRCGTCNGTGHKLVPGARLR